MTEIRDRLKPVIHHIHNDAGDLDYHSRLAWFGTMLTDIALAIGDEDVVHVDSRWSGSPSEGLNVELLVFTKETVVHASITTTLDGAPPVHSATVSRRDSLARLSVSGTTPLNSTDIATSWPGWITVTLGWEDGGEITLPLTRWDASHRALEELLPSLRTDLMR